MTALSKQSKKNYTAHAVFGVVSLSIVLLLVYIDEGHYSFEGLFALENLPALAFYFAIFFSIQAGIFHLIGQRINLLVSIIFGVATLFFLLAFFFFWVVVV